MMRSLNGSWPGAGHQKRLKTCMTRFDGNLPVNAQDLQNYGLSLIKKEDPSFKASSGWALR